MKYRVTAYENQPNGGRRIAKREVVIQTLEPGSGKVLGEKETKQQIRETIEGADEAAKVVRDVLDSGYLVDVRDAQGRPLNEDEFTPLAVALIG